MRPPGRSPFIHIDRNGRDGRQTQIYRAIRRAILDGTLESGARLLSSRALAEDLGVSRTTSLLAYEQLTAEGYLSARHGAGTFVADELPDDLPEAHRPYAHKQPSHPALSNRGTLLSASAPSALRLPGEPRPFRIGVPALEHFPRRLWSQLVNRRLRARTVSHLDYGDPAGQRPLREAIAAYVSGARGTQCTADQILIVAGAQRGLELIFRAFLDPRDEAIMEDPGYPGARNALASAGATVRAVPVDGEGIDVAALRRVRGKARLVYTTPSHQFPLGVPMTLPRRLALLHWARDASAWIVEDDYDSEYRYGARAIPCLHGLAADGRVVYVGSFSKTLFPALRLGFLVVPADLLPHLASIRRASDLHPPTFEQLVVGDMIADGHYERHLRRMRSICRERLEALAESARRLCAGALSLRSVQTGLHAVADLGDDLEADRVFQEARSRDVEVMPLSAYFATPSRSPQALVLGFGAVDPKAITSGMVRLAAALEASRGARRRKRAQHRGGAKRHGR
jgi:GntR family transcriptional regulator/MocR family aminotransferase